MRSFVIAGPVVRDGAREGAPELELHCAMGDNVMRNGSKNGADSNAAAATPRIKLAGDGYLTAQLIAASMTARECERRLARRAIQQAVARERRRVAQELDGGLSRQLFDIAARCVELKQALASRSLPEVATAARLITQVDAAISETRRVTQAQGPGPVRRNGAHRSVSQTPVPPEARRTPVGV